MSSRDHVFSIVATLQPVVQGVSSQDAERPTPCPDWTVRDAANHLLGTVEAMRRIGAGEPLDPQDPWGTSGDHLREDWRDDLSDLLLRWAQAWSQPEAWEGDAMDGAMPKQVIGDMGFVEVMLHGWDLARGTHQELEFDDDAVDQALEVMEQIGEQGRSQGAFGPEKSVPDDASTFAQVLARSGRDPEWTAG
jgi:uncharacterized protein (TIGR03086 family)